MSLTARINKEIKAWEDIIAQRQLRVDRMKMKLKDLQRLLDMAQTVEGE